MNRMLFNMLNSNGTSLPRMMIFLIKSFGSLVTTSKLFDFENNKSMKLKNLFISISINDLKILSF